MITTLAQLDVVADLHPTVADAEILPHFRHLDARDIRTKTYRCAAHECRAIHAALKPGAPA